MFGAAIEAIPRSVGVDSESEFCRDHHLLANWSEGFPYEFFVHERSIGLRGVEEGHAMFHGRPNEGDHLLLVARRSIGGTHAHAAEAEGGNFQVTLAKLSFLHGISVLEVELRGNGVEIAVAAYDFLWTPKLLRISSPGVIASLTTRSATLLRETWAEAFLNGSPLRVVA